MRQLKHFEDEQRARALGDVLLAMGIDNTVEPSREGGVAVWVHDEGRVNEAHALAADFEADPSAARFAGAAARAAARRGAQAQQEREARKRTIQVRQRFVRGGSIGAVTWALIAACVVVAFLTTSPQGVAHLRLGDKTEVVSLLSFQGYIAEGGYYRWVAGLPDLRSGQLWRLFTPMLLHFGLLHILFNMWWLRDLGTLIERRQSSWLFAVMVLVISALSNSAQYLFGGSPAFGGMSGVVYGLFAYAWIRGRTDPQSGYGIHPSAIYWMVGFYVLCWTGLVGPVANVAHTAGLVIGALWGWLAGGGHRRLRDHA
jgi:GlpG protein